MFVRDASGYPRGERPFKRDSARSFPPCASCTTVSLRPTVSFSPSHSLPFFLHFSLFPAIRLLSRRQDTGTDGRGNHEAPLFADLNARPISVSNSSHVSRIRRVKHFLRKIERDPRRLVNSREQVSRPFVFMITQISVIRFRVAPLRVLRTFNFFWPLNTDHKS